jgi:hypothetical protein
MSDFDIGYVMGLFVGEGCFTSYGPYRDGTRITRIWFLRGTALRTIIPLFFQHLPESHKREQFLAWLHKHELFLLYPRRKSIASAGPERSLDPCASNA